MAGDAGEGAGDVLVIFFAQGIGDLFDTVAGIDQQTLGFLDHARFDDVKA